MLIKSNLKEQQVAPAKSMWHWWIYQVSNRKNIKLCSIWRKITNQTASTCSCKSPAPALCSTVWPSQKQHHCRRKTPSRLCAWGGWMWFGSCGDNWTPLMYTAWHARSSSVHGATKLKRNNRLMGDTGGKVQHVMSGCCCPNLGLPGKMWLRSGTLMRITQNYFCYYYSIIISGISTCVLWILFPPNIYTNQPTSIHNTHDLKCRLGVQQSACFSIATHQVSSKTTHNLATGWTETTT